MTKAPLRFVHTTVHEMTGTTGPPTGETVLLNDSQRQVWACLTQDASQYCAHADESLALGVMMLRGLVGGGTPGSFGDRLRIEVETVRKQRRPSTGRTFLVFQRKGTVEDWEPRVEREVDDLVIRIDGSPSSTIEEASREPFEALLLSLSQVAKHAVRVNRYCKSIVFYRPDGKRVFAKTLAASADLTVSRALSTGEETLVGTIYDTYIGLDDLSRVVKLFAASVEESTDRLRAFQSGWMALEIFVNKVFSQYEKGFYSELLGTDPSEARTRYVTRIKSVMSGKYSLVDRFALIAETLAPVQADDDVADFASAKRVRDGLAHGQEVNERALPTEAVHRLLKTYLSRHAASRERR